MFAHVCQTCHSFTRVYCLFCRFHVLLFVCTRVCERISFSFCEWLYYKLQHIIYVNGQYWKMVLVSLCYFLNLQWWLLQRWFLLITITTRSAILRVYVGSFCMWTVSSSEHSFVFTVWDSCSISIEFISEGATFSMTLKKILFRIQITFLFDCQQISWDFSHPRQQGKGRHLYFCPCCVLLGIFLWSSEVRLYIAPSTLSRLSNNLVFLPIISSRMLFIEIVVASVNAPHFSIATQCDQWVV